MEDGVIKPNTMLETVPDSTIDFNLMDELLYDGFWLETTDGSNFWQPGATTPSDLNSTSFCFPTSDTNLDGSDTIPHQDSFLKETEKLTFFGDPSLSSTQMDEISGGQARNNPEPALPSVSLNQSSRFSVEDNDMNRRLWIGPNRNQTRSISVKKRLMQAINHLKDSTKDKDMLIQIWVPVKKGGRQVLTTMNQPFSLNPNSKNLAEYRDVSRTYQFAADKDSKEFVGLPGRVFLNKLPEWTPDVRFFKREEYPRVNHALMYDVRGSLALPVFEQGSGKCLGVVEIVTTSQQVNYRPELENICKALEAVHLKSSNILSPPQVEDCSESYQAALMEIKNVLKCVCDAHKLPLAQTWIPCIQQGKGGSRHSDENYEHCVSTMDSACYVADLQVSGFHDACSEHHLLKGEGIVGKAFLTNQPCFSEDITAFSKTEYPLAHHAKIFNLYAAVAIRLRSTYTGSADFVLEFFLPSNCNDVDNQRLMLDSLSSVIRQTCQSLRVVTDQELAQEISAREVGSSSAGILDDGKNINPVISPSKEPSFDASPRSMNAMYPKQKGKEAAVSLDRHKEEPVEEFKVTTQWNNSGLDLHHMPDILDNGQLQQDYRSKGSGKSSGSFSYGSGNLSLNTRTSSEKRRAKAEKNISLQVLRQYFAGSLKDAAKNIGVCPTTLKRICRQHGITRWPSRKIKKVGHSLKKLQLVIDSVQGAEGSIQLSSFYNNFPELVSPNAAGTSNLTTSKMSGPLPPAKASAEGTLLSPATTTSKSPSSSGSHSSSSSYCFSTGVKQSSFPATSGFASRDALTAEQNEGGLKRARSEAEVHDLGQEETKLLVRSYSHKIFDPHTSTENPPVQNNTTKVHDAGSFRVKATFGEEKIRLSLQPQWGFKDLQQEIFRRFNIDSGCRIDLKYLDDDAEWVLLTCDDDLEECIDIHKVSKSRTIKLSLNQTCHPSLGSSFGSNGPF